MTATGGTYTLVVRLDTESTIEVGALGQRSFEAGWYAYVGTALGPGGFARIERHCEIASGEREVRHWHIDYLLGHPAASIVDVRRSEGIDGECRLATWIEGTPVDGFGCSDCPCDSHLHAHSDRDRLLTAIEAAHHRLEGPA